MGYGVWRGQQRHVQSPPHDHRQSRQTTSDSLNRNLLKCIASSTTGTNDHYFEASTPRNCRNLQLDRRESRSGSSSRWR